MTSSAYQWRQMTPQQRAEVLAWRRATGRPWHSPPHDANSGGRQFLVSAACFEHQPHIGRDFARMDGFECELLDQFAKHANATVAWCVLPNHYHALIEAEDIAGLLHGLGLFHGRMSYTWNREEDTRGRRVFFRAVERGVRSERHLWATLNYVHYNPARHGYVENWTDWPWSSAAEFVEATGEAEVERILREYPMAQYGTGWDDAGM